MNLPTEELLNDAYAAFGRVHDARKQEFMAMINQRAAASKIRSRPKSRRQIVSLVAALAAAVLVAVGIGSLMRPAPAYGLEGLPERIRQLRSLYVKGWLYQKTKTEFGVATVRFPVERYYERPGKFYSVHYGFSLAGNDDLKQVTKITAANDGERASVIADHQKMAIVGPAGDSLDAELMVETGLQITELATLLGGMPKDFVRVGSERIEQRDCDIYESRKRGDENGWRRVWIDRRTGLPARVVGVMKGASGEAEPLYEYNEIRADEAPPADLFTVKVPEGFKLNEVKGEVKPAGIGSYSSGSAGDKHAAAWVGLKIDEQCVLLCWSQWTEAKGERKWFQDDARLMFEGESERQCTEQKLYETMSGDLRWRWSIVRAKDGKPVGSDTLGIELKEKQGGTMRLGVQPLVFDEQRLAELIVRVQRRSAGVAGKKKVLTLEEIRKRRK